ncbi:hypothetical protein Ahy_A08g037699 [Arachis hypogaea]|uniref:Uncharacterized protein n=1 Tax=Arachis hypogaea TaxID=3818 RepID=A0A445BRH8_ARAHY|nr:hypothetical protein Ahy_A08g037699 [Arachis hypogaea]
MRAEMDEQIVSEQNILGILPFIIKIIFVNMLFYACTVKSEIGTEELEEILRESRKKKNNEKSATQGEKEANLRSTEGHYVSSEM